MEFLHSVIKLSKLGAKLSSSPLYLLRRVHYKVAKFFTSDRLNSFKRSTTPVS